MFYHPNEWHSVQVSSQLKHEDQCSEKITIRYYIILTNRLEKEKKVCNYKFVLILNLKRNYLKLKKIFKIN